MAISEKKSFLNLINFGAFFFTNNIFMGHIRFFFCRQVVKIHPQKKFKN